LRARRLQPQKIDGEADERNLIKTRAISDSAFNFELIAAFEARASDYSLCMTGFLPKPERALKLLLQPKSQVFGVFLEKCLIGIL
jgi:hypothetical protein